MINARKSGVTPSLPSLTVLTSKKNRILAIAFACNPYQGSEQGVGWGWLGMLSQNHEVWCIVCQDNNRDITLFCADNPTSHYATVHYIFVDHRWNRTLNKIWPPYYLWQFKRQWLRDAYLQAKELHSNLTFDCCHLITYVGYRIPGEFYKLNCPFFWGPIGGIENTPWHMLSAMGLKGAVYYGMRNIVNSLQKRFLQAPKAAFKKASENGAIIAATSSIKCEIKQWYGVDSFVICEVGPPPTCSVSDITAYNRKNGEPLRICWSGQHQPGKALPLLLKALYRLPTTVDWRLAVLGDGPCSNKWKLLAEKLKLNEQIKWYKLIPRAEAISIMNKSHVFVITSLKDLTSSVLLEALSLGLPVVCPDHCGFTDIVSDCCGFKIPIDNIDSFVDQLSFRINELHDNKSLCHALATGATERIKEFDWEIKRKNLNSIYDSAVNAKVDN